MEEFLYFHDFALTLLVFILGLVRYMLFLSWGRRRIDTGLLEGQLLEGVWTIAPALVLVQIAVPSLLLLYSLDEGADCSVSLKAIGHQWYWSYEYSDLAVSSEPIEFDSYMETGGSVRLLDVDNRVALPWGVKARVLVGSGDVLHSWTIPSLGVKADACPGRLNQLKLRGHRPGLYFGQCSEICGANHRFIPIALEMVRARDFLAWANSIN